MSLSSLAKHLTLSWLRLSVCSKYRKLRTVHTCRFALLREGGRQAVVVQKISTTQHRGTTYPKTETTAEKFELNWERQLAQPSCFITCTGNMYAIYMHSSILSIEEILSMYLPSTVVLVLYCKLRTKSKAHKGGSDVAAAWVSAQRCWKFYVLQDLHCKVVFYTNLTIDHAKLTMAAAMEAWHWSWFRVCQKRCRSKMLWETSKKYWSLT